MNLFTRLRTLSCSKAIALRDQIKTDLSGGLSQYRITKDCYIILSDYAISQESRNSSEARAESADLWCLCFDVVFLGFRSGAVCRLACTDRH